VIESPYRSLTAPLLQFLSEIKTLEAADMVTVVLPEFVVPKWRFLILHNQNALFVKRLFLFEDHVVLSSVPFVLHDELPESAPAAAGDH